MRSVKKHIPNTLTCLNLFSGCVGVVFAFRGELTTASLLIYLGAVFDFFDGFTARQLKVSSAIGKELDSLADMITFSFLPACILFVMISNAQDSWTNFIVFVVAVFSALRLAKFNIDERQSDRFYGLPTPASAMFVSALPFYIQNNFLGLGSFISQPQTIIIIAIILSILMVSDIPLIALKFKDFSFKNNKFRYLLIMSSIVLIIAFKVHAFPIIIILYVLLSLLSNSSKQTGKQSA